MAEDHETGSHDEVGSVGEEAAKLFAALQGWARDNGSEYADAASSAAAEAATTLGSLNDHIATGGAECRYCPVCQLISAVRATSPEVKENLTLAASSLMRAVAGIMETQVPDRAADTRRGGSTVEHIDLDPEGQGDDEWDGDTWD